MSGPLFNDADLADLRGRELYDLPHSALITLPDRVSIPDSGGDWTTVTRVIGTEPCRLAPLGAGTERVIAGEEEEVAVYDVAFRYGANVLPPYRLLVTHALEGIPSPLTIEVEGVLVRSYAQGHVVRARRIGNLTVPLGQIPARVVITPASTSGAVGEEVVFVAEVQEADGTPIPAAKASFFSLTPAAVTVDQATGRASILSGAPATVVAVFDQYAAAATINAAAALPVASVAITLGAASVVQGGIVAMLVRAFDANGAEKVGEAVTAITSSNDAIVDASGAALGLTPLLVLLPAVAAGAVDVVATVGGVDSPPAAVTVTPATTVEVGSIVASVDPIVVDEGDTVDVVLRAFDPATTELLGEQMGVLTDREDLATVAPHNGVTPLTVTVTGVAGGAARLLIFVGDAIAEVDITVVPAPVADPGPVMAGLTRWYRPEAAQVTAGALTDRAGSGSAMQLGTTGAGDWNQPDFDAARNMVFGDTDDTMLAPAANVGAEWAIQWCMEFPGSKPAPTSGVSPVRLTELAATGDYALYAVLGAITTTIGGVIVGYNVIRAIVRAAAGTTTVVRTTMPAAHDPAGRPVSYCLQREPGGNVVFYLDGTEVGRITTGTVAKPLAAPALFSNFAQFWMGTILFYAGKSLSAAERSQNRDHMRAWHAGLP